MKGRPFIKNNMEEEFSREDSFGKKNKISKLKLSGAIILVIIVLWCLATFASNVNSWKMVVLDSNQVYFGKFITIPFSSTITLKHAYFLQTAKTASSSMNVVSITSDLQAPRDFMVINRDHMIFSEVLRPDSTFVKLIEKQDASVK